MPGLCKDINKSDYKFIVVIFNALEICFVFLYNLLISNDRGGKDKMAKEGKEKKKGS